VQKEARRKVANANDIPLQERECLHTGDCAGTCPYCESEVRYLERELSKRRALGKAVAVAGIALSAVSMVGCATSEPVSSNSSDKPRKTSGRDITDALSWMGAVVVENNGKPEACNPEKNNSKKEKKSRKSETYQIRGIVPMTDTLPKIDTAMMVTPSNPQNDEVIIGLVDDLGFQNWIYKEEQGTVPESIPGFTPAVFTEGQFEAWLRGQLQKFQSYMQDPRLDSVEIRFFVEEDGYVSLINILNMPAVYKQEDEAFRAKVTAVISGSEWIPATVSDGKPVSSIVTVRLRDLR